MIIENYNVYVGIRIGIDCGVNEIGWKVIINLSYWY